MASVRIDLGKVPFKLRHKGRLAERLCRRAVYFGGLHLERLAKLRTPVDTGALKASARTHLHNKGAYGVAVAEVSYRGVYYALWVHEILWYHHEIGGAKFLENAIIYSHKAILATIKQVLKDGAV